MTSSTCCKSTLPVIAQHTQAAYISFQKKKNEMVENSVTQSKTFKDRVPLPSAGTTERKNSSAEDDNEQRPEGSGNLLLSSNWKTGNAKTNFRNVVRAIIRAARWKIPLVKDSHSAQDLSKTWYEEQDTLHFNVNAFKTGRSGNPGLSKRARFVLMKDTWERTDKELELIHSVVNQMKCFVKYSDLVRRELARVMHLETFEDGRIIIQEGHPGFSMYFIVTGSVIVQVSHTDSRTGEKKNHVVGELTAGSSFGELALVQDCKRSATISCQGTVQFLRVDKPDFDMVLRRSYEQQWKGRLRMIKSLPFFSNWKDNHLRHINLNCHDVNFAPHSVILGDTTDVTEEIYFVLRGKCQIIRQVTVLETTSHLVKGQTMLSLPTPSDAIKALTNKSKQMSQRFLVIGKLDKGDYFGVGENMYSTYIMASSKVQCLAVSRHAFVSLERVLKLSENELGKFITLKEMLNVTESRLLNEKEAFERWMTNLRWRNFRKKIVNEIIMKKPAALRNPQKSKEAIKSPTLYELRSKSSTLGYPLADNNNKSTPIWKRSGYVNKKKVQFPSIDGKNSEDQNNQNEKVNNDLTNKASSSGRKPLHFPTTRLRGKSKKFNTKDGLCIERLQGILKKGKRFAHQHSSKGLTFG